MIIEYNPSYAEEVKDLLVELQEHIVSIDKEQYNILTPNYQEAYFQKTMEEIQEYEGKMFLYQEEEQVIGLVVGIINNEAMKTYDFEAPKRGRITELIVSQKRRSKGYGKKLLQAMEHWLKEEGCQDILLGVFGYNEKAISFYEDNGYHMRMLEMTKKLP